MELHETSFDSEEKIQVKTEPREEDIKGYAENTMNELLAIYGYEKVDEGVTKELHLHHFSDKDDEREAEGSHDGVVIKQEVEEEEEETYDIKPQISDNDISDHELNDLQINDHQDTDHQVTDHEITGYQIGDHQVSGYQMSGPSSPVDDHLNNSSGASASAYTSAECSDGESNPSAGYEIICAWCQHYGFKRYTLNTTTESKAFCSEKCFAACRRAYFRRNKVCDWCRHIRHTKEYIDFQDGERKLQFCSEKCLHQYKMDVFCQETQTLGSSGVPSVESSSVVEPVVPSEQTGTGAINACSSDDTECGDCSMLLSVAADSSTQPYIQGNGIHPVASPQAKEWPVLATRTQQKSKTVFGAQQVPIAPKVNASSSQPPPKVTQVSVAAASVTPPNVIPTRINQTNPAGQVLGLQTIIQPGVGNSQIMGRTPVVVRGTHWPPVVRQIPGYVIPGQQQPSPPVVQHPRRILPAPPAKNLEVSTPATKKAFDTSAPPLQKSSTPEVKSNEGSQSSGPSLSHLLPPVTVMVPQPIFIPIPYPIPIPVPVPEETFHAMRAACAESRRSPREACSSINTERGKASGASSRLLGNSSSNLDLRPGRYQPTLFQEAFFHRQTDPEFVSGGPHRVAIKRHQGLSQQKDPSNYPKINEPASCPEDARHKAWQAFFECKTTLQRSASMDLSLARHSEEVASKSLHKLPRSERGPGPIISRDSGNVNTHQDAYLTPDAAVHLSGESSAKVREALRCHLTKRLSQSALNLTEVGRMPNPQDDLRRCQSLSRLRYLEPNHMEKLPELTDGCSSPSRCSSASSTQRSNPNPHEKEEEKEEEEEEELLLQEDPQDQALEPASDEDTMEPESKRKCVNHV